MPKLFLSLLTLLSAQSALVLGASQCPQPEDAAATDIAAAEISSAELHAAMQTAQQSARERLDWVVDPATDSACAGYYQEPANPNPQQHLPVADADTHMSASQVERTPQGFTELYGDVEFYQGSLRFRCDTLRFANDQNYSELEGDIQLRQPGMLLLADKAVLDGANQHSWFENAEYVLHEQQLHGKAKRIEGDTRSGGYLQLNQASFTLCPPTAEHWVFSSRELELDMGKGWGTAHHAVFRIEDVPVLYIPYLDFPLDDRRKSGFLWPSISSNGGFDIAIPYYFNLAPNYDMTYIARYNSEHGYQHGIEGRYKQRYSEWALGGTYISNDKEVGDEETADDDSLDEQRWLGFVQEHGRFNANWSSNIDYQAVSDVNYFRDWGTVGLDVKKSLNIKRQAQLNYRSERWQADSRVVDYQRLELDSSGDELEEDYRLLPQINLRYRPENGTFRLQPQLFSQYSFFDHEARTRGQRLVLQPGLTLPLRWQAGELVPNITHKRIDYRLNESNDADEVVVTDAVYQGSHSVAVNTSSLDGKLFFERLISHNNNSYLQTLTPRLFYYYAENQEQNRLPNFDTGENAFSYRQIFRGERFSGFDRIGDANQLSIGLSSSITDNVSGRRLFDFGIGQIHYNSEREVALSADDRTLLTIDSGDTAAEKEQKALINHEIDKKYYRNASDIAAEANWFFSSNHRLSTELIWDPYSEKTSEGRLGYHFMPKQDLIVNIGYRYKRNIPLIDSDGELFDNDIEQMDSSLFVPLNRQWHGFARWHYDVVKSENIENMVGLQYEGCCWGVKLAFQRERKTFENNQRIEDTAAADYSNSWMIQFELKGLGGVSNTISKLLEESIQGYQERE